MQIKTFSLLAIAIVVSLGVTWSIYSGDAVADIAVEMISEPSDYAITCDIENKPRETDIQNQAICDDAWCSQRCKARGCMGGLCEPFRPICECILCPGSAAQPGTP